MRTRVITVLMSLPAQRVRDLPVCHGRETNGLVLGVFRDQVLGFIAQDVPAIRLESLVGTPHCLSGWQPHINVWLSKIKASRDGHAPQSA